MAINIDKHACPQNHKCPLLRVCPTGAISQTGVGLPIIDESKCIDCGKCIRYCGMQAMYLSK
ncbi:MAG: 4Fe-4S binding protein [Paludibacteraceae bacterium]|nr:4Fe-4S binding protein [Paludibacteraceae bacterium]